ncbi:hypothetical protein lerEdw1_011381 [Lerista edwardsae]|nr:hypothetical protein lerEdw1_011381 [Lerista edwardsae]
MTSPFHSPPSTPISPQVQSHSSESDEMPVSFDEPPEGSHLQFYNKVRTRGSIKRRPPSRRFRKSQSEFGDDQELGVTVSPQENGAKMEEDGVFTDKGKTVKPLSPPVDGVDHHVKQNQIAADEKTSTIQGSRGTETTESKIGEVTSCKDSKEEQKNSEKELCDNIKESKDKSPDHRAAEDTEGQSSKSPLRDKEAGDASNQENKDKGEKEEKIRKSEDAQPVSDTQDTGTPQHARDTETAVSSKV